MKDFDISKWLKTGVYELNPERWFGVKSIQESIDLINKKFLDCKREENLGNKINKFNICMAYQGVGELISWEGLLELFDFIGISQELFEESILHYTLCQQRNLKHFHRTEFNQVEKDLFKIEYSWYLNLKKEGEKI
jgi:hypothetical protein